MEYYVGNYYQNRCDYLSIQPSNVASEKVFSRAGLAATNDRENLTILMYSWLKESQKKSNSLNNLPGL